MNRNRFLCVVSLALALPAAAQETKSPALNALTSGAARPDCAMQGVTGENCPPADASAVQAPPTSGVKPDAARPAIAHRKEAAVPSPAPKKKSILHKVQEYFKPDTVKAGVAIGAAIGMVMLAGSPVGIVGGALIGAAIGAILVGGLIGKLWHAVHKS